MDQFIIDNTVSAISRWLNRKDDTKDEFQVEHTKDGVRTTITLTVETEEIE
jgi:hypothetical protein